MAIEANGSTVLWRRCVRVGIGVLGIVSIVGSGGGLPAFCDWNCPGGDGGLPPPPLADLSPSRMTVQLGSPVTFAVVTTSIAQATYRWCRQAGGSNTCSEIAGAAGPSYTLAAANLGDDDTLFRVTVTGSNGSAVAQRHLSVSPMPGVTYQDGDFAASDWDVTATVQPSTAGATWSTARSPSGGNPDAFQNMVFDLPQVPSSVSVNHLSTAAGYAPSTQGAILSLDFAEDCLSAAPNYVPDTLPLIEQGGRRFTALPSWGGWSCSVPVWQASSRPSLGPEHFERVDGPACSVGESCPDFSANGAPIHFGYVSVASLTSGLPPGTSAPFAYGIDNWKVTVWRR